VKEPRPGFSEFYSVSSRRLLPALIAATGDPQEAQDCLQEAFTRAAARWKRVASCDSPEAWVRRVALNLAVDGHRRRRTRWRMAQAGRPPTPAPAPGETSLDVVRAVRQLPRHQRDVIVLHYLLDMSVDDVARELDRPVNTVKTQLLRARSRLLELLPVDHEEETAR
jgi:RNA polymerase sigma-70 factor (ECF subfamily)